MILRTRRSNCGLDWTVLYTRALINEPRCYLASATSTGDIRKYSVYMHATGHWIAVDNNVVTGGLALQP